MSAEGALLDQSACLIETLGSEASGAIRHLDRHLARLGRSARALGFAFDANKAREALQAAAKGADSPLRLRLALQRDGAMETAAVPFAPPAPDLVWRVGAAEARLASGDPLLAHKVSQRPVYDAARAEMTGRGLDEILLMNERGEFCEGSVTSLFIEKDGALLTPPTRCGLLPGILREILLEEGRAREAVLRRPDLDEADAVFVGNSLRGLIRAAWSDH